MDENRDYNVIDFKMRNSMHNIEADNFTDVYYTPESLQNGLDLAKIVFFKDKSYNYFWAGTSAFFENDAFDYKKSEHNKEMVNRILAPLKGLINEDYLGKTPAMHYEKTESLFGYPLVHFKIEYK